MLLDITSFVPTRSGARGEHEARQFSFELVVSFGFDGSLAQIEDCLTPVPIFRAVEKFREGHIRAAFSAVAVREKGNFPK